MQKLNLAICDDMQSTHAQMKAFLEKFAQENNLDISTRGFLSSSELLNSDIDFQILFLDIEMPDMDGIELAKKIQGKLNDVCIIMLSGKPERFKEAFEINAFRFVTKPIDEKELFSAIHDAKNKILSVQSVTLSIGGAPMNVPMQSILYIESHGDYLIIICTKQNLECRTSLKVMESLLDEQVFISCHKSYIINLAHVADIEQKSLTLDNGVKLPVAKRRRQSVFRAWIAYDLNFNN